MQQLTNVLQKRWQITKKAKSKTLWTVNENGLTIDSIFRRSVQHLNTNVEMRRGDVENDQFPHKWKLHRMQMNGDRCERLLLQFILPAK